MKKLVARLVANTGYAWPTIWLFILLPNAIFMALSPWYLIRRGISPLVYLLACMLGLLLPLPFTVLLLLMAAAVDAYFIVSLAFGMPFEASLASIQYVDNIDVSLSTLYVCGIVYFLIVGPCLAALIHRRRLALRQASPIPATALAFALVCLD